MEIWKKMYVGVFFSEHSVYNSDVVSLGCAVSASRDKQNVNKCKWVSFAYYTVFVFCKHKHPLTSTVNL